MERSTRVGCFALLLFACGGEPPPPAAAEPTPTVPTPAPAQPVAPSPDPAQPNPCATPGPLTIELDAGVAHMTPWGLELSYGIEDDGKRPPGYVFLLRSGTRRWETRRNEGNWSSKQTWRGFCWRGGARPERRASKLQIDIAPVCKDGALVEVGGCGNALGGGVTRAWLSARTARRKDAGAEQPAAVGHRPHQLGARAGERAQLGPRTPRLRRPAEPRRDVAAGQLRERRALRGDARRKRLARFAEAARDRHLAQPIELRAVARRAARRGAAPTPARAAATA